MGTLGGSNGTLDTKVLDGIVGMADAGGIDEAEGDVAQLDGVFDGVTRSALYVADDGAFFAKQSIEQGALAYVRGSDDGYGDAVLEGVTSLEGLGKTGDMFVNVLGEFK